MAKCEYCVYTLFPLHFSPDPFSSPFRQPPPPHRGGDLARLRQARPLRRHHRLLQGPHRPSSQLSVNAGRGSSLSFYLSFSVSDVRHAFSRYCCCVKDKENGHMGRCLETDLGEKVKDGRATRTRPGLSPSASINHHLSAALVFCARIHRSPISLACLAPSRDP